jgi:uncharacterized protein YdaU (DUF1376 family)
MTALKNKPKMGEPLPYYRWYWRDWRGSRAVQKMTALERGIYRELLDEQWRIGHLVNDPAWLADAAMCTEQELANAWQMLSKCFPPIEGTDGQLLANTRLEAERTENDTLRAKRATAGRLGGKANAKQMLHSSSRAEQSSSNAAEAVAALRLGGASAPACECGDDHHETCPNRLAPPNALSDILSTLKIR